TMPFRDTNYSIFENYCYFAAAFSAIKLFAAANYVSENDSEKNFKASSAYISRYFAHNDLKVAQILDIFKNLNCMSPAYIALIIN
ncbi:MAG: YkgJ family cysteine cluster protein, partial [Oscillospiraceae bacterium]|nr:YkgJ family cysteine cluster protein [Oscillospiraceae bacterium]